MTNQNKMLKKMFLLNETSFQKIKDIEDTERNFNALDKHMRAILYNKKLNDHEKLVQYTELLEKYLKLRKQLLTKYGENTLKTPNEPKKQKQGVENPFDSANMKNFPRLSTIFDSTPTVNPEVFNFNKTLQLEGNEKQSNDISMVDLHENFPKNTGEYFSTSGEIGDPVQLPPISASAAARESSIGDNTFVDLASLGDKIKITWKGLPYTIEKRFVKNFNEFTRKVQIKYPLAKSFALSDFVNYVVNGSVIIKSVEKKKLLPPVQRLDRKRKSAVKSTDEIKKLKSSQIDEFYPERKKNQYVLQPTKFGQTGQGIKPNKKWITFR